MMSLELEITSRFMDKRHREMIALNFDDLVEKTENIDLLLDELVSTGTLTEAISDEIKKNDDPEDRARDLYLLLPKAGPDAFQNLIDAFHETGNANVALILKDNRLCNQSPAEGLSPTSESDNESEEDIENSIIKWKDQDCLSQFSCGIIILMAHGSEGQEPGTVNIATKDKKFIPSEWIIQNMSAANAPNLHERPKLIFILTCRGEHPDYGTDIDKLQQLMSYGAKRRPLQLDAHYNGFFEPAPQNVAPSLSDVLLVYPCAPGKASTRSLFVQEMCQVFRNKAHKDDVETMLKEMDRNLGKRPGDVFQIVCTTSRGFNRKLFLNPVKSFTNGR